VREALPSHGLEGPRADVERDVRGPDAALRERGEQGLAEGQPGGRRGDRAGRARVDGLVARLVFGLGSVRDVRRQGQAAVTLDEVEGIRALREAQPVELAFAAEDAKAQAAVE